MALYATVQVTGACGSSAAGQAPAGSDSCRALAAALCSASGSALGAACGSALAVFGADAAGVCGAPAAGLASASVPAGPPAAAKAVPDWATSEVSSSAPAANTPTERLDLPTNGSGLIKPPKGSKTPNTGARHRCSRQAESSGPYTQHRHRYSDVRADGRRPAAAAAEDEKDRRPLPPGFCVWRNRHLGCPGGKGRVQSRARALLLTGHHH